MRMKTGFCSPARVSAITGDLSRLTYTTYFSEERGYRAETIRAMASSNVDFPSR
jgi:hypothetical protein